MQYIEKIKEVESTETTKCYTEFVEAFQQIKIWAESQAREDYKEMAKFEVEICALCERSSILSVEKNSRFVTYGISNDGTQGPKVDDFTENQFEYYEKRLIETNNVFLKKRYSDFLFEYGKNKITLNKYKVSLYLIFALIEIIEYYKELGDNEQCLFELARLVEVILMMENKEALLKAIHLINSISIQCEEEREDYLIVRASIIFRSILSSKHKDMISQENPISLIERLENIRKKTFENKDYPSHMEICEELIEYRKLNFLSSERVKELQLCIGRGYELEAEYQQGSKKPSLFKKARFFEEAMKHYVSIGESGKVEEMKKITKEVYEQLEQSKEMKTISVPIEIPKENIDCITKSYISSDVQKSLDNIAYNFSGFVPDVKLIEVQTLDLAKEFLLPSLVSKAIVSDGKKVEQSVTAEDSFKIDLNRNYMQELNLKFELLVKRIFEILIEDYNLNAEDFMRKFDRWELLDKRNRPFVEVGIKRFLEGDYISSLHILVPQFESTLRRLFANAGYATTSIKKGTAQHEETFNEFLKREEIKDALGENIHKLIQIVMVEQTGLNLRNDIAHGLIGFSNVTKTKCVLVIYLYLLLTNIKYSIE